MKKFILLSLCLVFAFNFAFAESAPKEITLDFESAYEGEWHDLEGFDLSAYIPSNYELAQMPPEDPDPDMPKILASCMFADYDNENILGFLLTEKSEKFSDEFIGEKEINDRVNYELLNINGKLTHINSYPDGIISLVDIDAGYLSIVKLNLGESADMEQFYKDVTNIIASLKEVEK